SILDIQLPFPIERCVCEFLEPREVAGGQVEALAVAVRREDLAARLEKLKTQSIDVTHLDAEPLALWTQSIDEAPLDHESLRVVLYIGHDRAALALGRGAACLGGHAARAGVCHLFGGSGEVLQAFALRVRQVLQAQWKDDADGPMQWALCGPGLDDARHVDKLKAALARPETAQFFQHKQPAGFLARALATRALVPGPYRCNFRSGAFEHPRVSGARETGTRRAAVAALAAGLVLCVLNVGWRQALSARTASAQAQLSALASELSGVPRVPLGQEVVVAERAAAERSSGLQPLLDAVSPGPASRMATVLAGASTAQVTLDTATMTAQAMVLSGRAASWNSVDAFVEVLRNDGWNVSVDRGDAGADDRVPFSVRAVR
ncbi:MAG TPA: hypothetical protein VIH35_05545, partial [Kiritimatiellia bacterium]